MSRNRAISIALLLFAGLFITLAALQYLYARHKIRETVGVKLALEADNLLGTMDPHNQLDLAALRRAAPHASQFIILASDGTFISTAGFVKGTVSYADLPSGLSYDHPVLVKSSLGEDWHLFARKVKGGTVIVGESGYSSPADIDTRLLDAAKRFGDSLESAMGHVLQDQDAQMDFAVLADDGIVDEDHGGIPLKVKKKGLLLRADGPIATVAGRPFFVDKVPVMDRAKHQIGTIAVITDFKLEEEMLHDVLFFNIVVAASCVFLSGLVLFLDFYKTQ